MQKIRRAFFHLFFGASREGWVCSRLLIFLALLSAGQFYTGAAFAQEASIRDRLTVVVDDNYPPFAFRDESGHLQGYVVDYWALWAEKTGVEVDLRGTNWALAQDMLLTGAADMIDLMFRTDVREKSYAFSESYAHLPVNIYVHDSILGINSMASLRGFTVGVMDGDACIDVLEKADVSALRRFPDYAAVITAAAKGDIRIFCMDELPANFYFYRLGLGSDYQTAFHLYDGEFHRAVRLGNEAVLDRFAAGDALITDAEKAALRDKWLKVTSGGVDFRTPFLVTVVISCLVISVVLMWTMVLRAAVAARTSELERLNQSLNEALRVDILSGIPNRFSAIEALQRAFSTFRRYGSIYSVIMFDIDRFKDVNDTYGHEVGDRVIASLAERVRSLIRETDIVCRFGGEEFLIVLPETALSDAAFVAEKVRRGVADLRLDPDILITVSAGVSGPRSDDQRYDDVVKRADALMYRAKAAGRNTVCSDDAELSVDAWRA